MGSRRNIKHRPSSIDDQPLNVKARTPKNPFASNASAARALYRPLNASTHEIRLLNLHAASGPGNCEVRADLIHASFISDAQLPAYETLSYVWGEPLFTERLELHGEPFYTTPNLLAALRYLRPPPGGAARKLWVDALCINQLDDAERSTQVLLMRDVYTRTVADIAWLGMAEGEHAHRLERGLSLMKQIQNHDPDTLQPMRDETAHLRELYATPEQKTWHRVPDGDQALMLKSDDQRALETVFCESSLWTRVWIVQELSLAPQVVLIGGGGELDWEVISNFLSDQPYADAFHGTFSHGSISPMFRQTFTKVQEIEHQRSAMKRVGAGKDKSTLLDVLARFKNRQATNPRDRIYGFLGIATEDHGIVPDYFKSIEQIFAEVTASLIRASSNLDIICQNPWGRPWTCGTSINTRPRTWFVEFEDLPSWVANFSGTERNNVLFAQRDIYTAGKPTCEVEVDYDNKMLFVTGTPIDRVGPLLQESYLHPSTDHWTAPMAVAPIWDARTMARLYFGDDLSGVEHAIYPLPPGRTDDNPLTASEPALQAFWRCHLLDCTNPPHMRRLTKQEIADQHGTFVNYLKANLPEDRSKRMKTLSEYHGLDWKERLPEQRMLDWPEGHFTFTRSTHGLFLMVQPAAREGDVIAVLDGGKVPVLLRKVERGYQFVCVAYVHGYMDGEACNEAKEVFTLV